MKTSTTRKQRSQPAPKAATAKAGRKAAGVTVADSGPDVVDFLKRRVAVFKDFSRKRLDELVRGSRVAVFEANEVVANQGGEALHFGVVLEGSIGASVP